LWKSKQAARDLSRRSSESEGGPWATMPVAAQPAAKEPVFFNGLKIYL